MADETTAGIAGAGIGAVVCVGAAMAARTAATFNGTV
jgi:hypothetical protein